MVRAHGSCPWFVHRPAGLGWVPAALTVNVLHAKRKFLRIVLQIGARVGDAVGKPRVALCLLVKACHIFLDDPKVLPLLFHLACDRRDDLGRRAGICQQALQRAVGQTDLLGAQGDIALTLNNQATDIA